MDSILNTIKKMLGITTEYTVFDQDLIVHINAALMVLNQLGIGPEESYSIVGASNTWDEFLEDSKNFEAVKTYVYLRVKLAFDPPSNSFTIDSMKNIADEMEWRLVVQTRK